MKKRNMKKGFTLVELVIVIAVIAILAGVLIPTFGGVIEKANKSAALQEARNEYTAYLADYDYVNPPAEGQVKEGYVMVENGDTDYFFEIENGALNGKVVESATAPDNASQVTVIKTACTVTTEGHNHESGCNSVAYAVYKK